MYRICMQQTAEMQWKCTKNRIGCIIAGLCINFGGKNAFFIEYSAIKMYLYIYGANSIYTIIRMEAECGP